MQVHFADPELQRLYTDNVGADKYSAETVMRFRRRIRHIEASKDLDDLRSAGGILYCGATVDEGLSSLDIDDSYELIISEPVSPPIIVHRIISKTAGTS